MPGNEPIHSVLKAIELLYVIAGSEEGETVPQLAARLGCKRHAVYRLVRTLEQEKLLERTEPGTIFTLGPGVAELHAINQERYLLNTASGVLKLTSTEIPEANWNLAVGQGTETYQRLVVRSGKPGIVRRLRHLVIHSYSKASSLVVLAYATPADAAATAQKHPFEKEGLVYWKSEDHLREFLRLSRSRGYVLPDFTDGGFFRIAAPVFFGSGQFAAAMGGYIDDKSPLRTKRRLVRLVRDAASEISRKVSERTLRMRSLPIRSTAGRSSTF